jgi:hypothetical protein
MGPGGPMGGPMGPGGFAPMPGQGPYGPGPYGPNPNMGMQPMGPGVPAAQNNKNLLIILGVAFVVLALVGGVLGYFVF